MSKYKLDKLLSEVQGGRIGTLNISARGLEMTMEDLENEGATVNRFYDSSDGKTYIEYHVHPDGDYNPDTSFSVYDFKFGEDPADIDNEDKEYPFSIGGRSSALKSAISLLGLDNEKTIDENEAVDLAIEASQEKAGIEVNENNLNEMDVDLDQELRSRLSACLTKIKNHEERTGEMFYQEIAFDIENIIERLDDIQDVVSNEPLNESLNPEVIKKVSQFIKAMAKRYDYSDQDAVYAIMSALRKGDYDGVNENTIEEGAMKSIISALGEYGNESEIEMYMDSLRKSGDSFDDVEDYVEDFKNYIADKSLQEHFGRFMKDYQ